MKQRISPRRAYARRKGAIVAAAVIAFVGAAASGMALFHPALYWLSNLLGGGRWSVILHPFVGIAMMLGGNIRGATRNITTSIALQTSKGEFANGAALGIILLVLTGALWVALPAAAGIFAFRRRDL